MFEFHYNAKVHCFCGKDQAHDHGEYSGGGPSFSSNVGLTLVSCTLVSDLKMLNIEVVLPRLLEQ